ncbi:hypothetical protein NDU88_000690 [Pleurodeles waltl]|uniref:Uncharacterized protein n=1 Tax=Pleurodeles waltl TaxID=8319 RepID=A0AAV7MMS0_PLEWA|nr:hypothetical protein NDU88_000690 [Pleurodeles waltl]
MWNVGLSGRWNVVGGGWWAGDTWCEWSVPLLCVYAIKELQKITCATVYFYIDHEQERYLQREQIFVGAAPPLCCHCFFRAGEAAGQAHFAQRVVRVSDIAHLTSRLLHLKKKTTGKKKETRP